VSSLEACGTTRARNGLACARCSTEARSVYLLLVAMAMPGIRVEVILRARRAAPRAARAARLRYQTLRLRSPAEGRPSFSRSRIVCAPGHRVAEGVYARCPNRHKKKKRSTMPRAPRGVNPMVGLTLLRHGAHTSGSGAPRYPITARHTAHLRLIQQRPLPTVRISYELTRDNTGAKKSVPGWRRCNQWRAEKR